MSAGKIAALGIVFVLFQKTATASVTVPTSPSQLLPSFESVKKTDVSSELILQDRAGYRFDSVRLDPKVRKAPWVALDEIAPIAKSILIATEDQHFFEHAGVDWFSIAANAVRSAIGKRARGASTLTMQLVSLIDPEHARHGKRDLSQKWNQIEAALTLEKTWTKDQILEAYLNLVPLRGELIGIHSAARFLFHKEVSSLDPVEAALIVAMLPAPNDRQQKITKRTCAFLAHVYQSNPARAHELCAEAGVRVAMIQKQESALSASRATESYTRYALAKLPNEKKRGGFLKTSLDSALQERVLQYGREVLRSIETQHVSEIAAIVYQNDTGEILTYLGNVPEYSKSPHVDGVQAKRQAGSTLKPFFYAEALHQRLFDLNSTLEDEPILIQTSNGAFRPDNYDHVFRGKVSVPLALASSLNIPAIHVVQALGVNESVELLKKIGIKDLKPGYIYGPSLALGTVDLSLEELTHAYLRFANQALAGPKTDFPIDAKSAQIVTRILSDPEARAATFGLNSVLSTPYFTAVKTGTSKDMRDNWCVGFSDRYTVGVWVGNFDGTPMKDVSGVSGAAPLWRRIMDDLNEKRPSQVPPVIAGIQLPKIDKVDQRREKMKATQITYPQNEAILALDPEIPEDRQKMLFRTEQSEKNQFWYLNDEKLGPLSEPLLWKIKKGRYTLEVRNERQEKLDQVRFSVR